MSAIPHSCFIASLIYVGELGRKVSVITSVKQILPESINTFYQFIVFSDEEHGQKNENNRDYRRYIAIIEELILYHLCSGHTIVCIAEAKNSGYDTQPAEKYLKSAKFKKKDGDKIESYSNERSHQTDKDEIISYDGKLDIDGEIMCFDHGMHHGSIHFDDGRKDIACHDQDGEKKEKSLFAL